MARRLITFRRFLSPSTHEHTFGFSFLFFFLASRARPLPPLTGLPAQEFPSRGLVQASQTHGRFAVVRRVVQLRVGREHDWMDGEWDEKSVRPRVGRTRHVRHARGGDGGAEEARERQRQARTKGVKFLVWCGVERDRDRETETKTETEVRCAGSSRCCFFLMSDLITRDAIF